MRRSASVLLLVMACHAAAVPPQAAAQPAAPNASPPAGGVQEAKPDIYYLKDKDGLQPVLGFTIEDFERLHAQQAAAAATTEKPAYNFDQLEIKGRALAEPQELPGRAELTIDATISVLEDGWVAARLRLTELALVDNVEFHGAGEHFVVFDDRTKEYVAWLKGRGAPHRLTLRGVAPLKLATEEYALELSLPRARVSTFDFTVPYAIARGRTTEGAILEGTSHRDEETRFSVRGAGGKFAFYWSDASKHASAVATLLEATGLSLVRIDGPMVTTEAKLTVRSFDGAFDRFRVRLPPGASLSPSDDTNFSVRTLEAEGAAERPNQEAADRRVVEVVLRNRTQGPATVTLVTHHVQDPLDQSAVELAGFEVLDAVRQWGQIAVQVVGDWDIRWGQRQQVRQIEDLPTELRREGVVAGFEYFAQPFSLQARVVPRQTRTSVEPDYEVEVSPHRMTLRGRLKFQARGAKVFEVQLDMAGWRLDKLGPADLVDTLEISTEAQNGLLTIPLLQAASNEWELEIEASKDIPEGASSIEFALPRPKANVVGAAALLVLPADNVEVVPNDDLPGLQLQRVAPTLETPREQPPQFYRGDVGKARYSAEFQVLKQVLNVSVRSNVEISNEMTRVDQTLLYSIEHEPLMRVLLSVPQEVIETNTLEVLQDGESLSIARTADATVDPMGGVLVRVTLTRPQYQSCALRVRFSQPREPILAGTTVTMKAPLVMPAQGTLVSNELTITGQDGLKIQSRGAPWVSREGAADGDESSLHLTSTTPVAEAAVAIHREEQRAAADLIVERAWLRSVLVSDRQREERAVYVFRSDQPSITLSLPDRAENIEVLLNGARIRPRVQSNGDITVRLPSSRTRRRLELAYRIPGRHTPGEFQLLAPELPESAWVQRTYWQVVLPRHEHIVSNPPGFAPEYRWTWRGFYWGREPLLDQDELEAWSGATAAPPVARETNKYLFSAQGPIAPMQLYSATRSTIVLSAAGFALVLGLIFIYVPQARRPDVWLVLGIATLVGLALAPEISIIFLQTAVVGILLTGLSVWLNRRFTKNRRYSAPVPPSTSGQRHRGSTNTRQYAPSGSNSSTRTVQPADEAQIIDNALESKS